MRILVNTPSLRLLGGVANHYLGLKDYWTENVKYNTVGKRFNKNGGGILWLPYDILKFIFRLLMFRPDVVLLNPSLGSSALKRDFIFLNIARSLGFKVAVMIHGFDWNYAAVIDKSWVSQNLNKAFLIFVLAQAFKEELQSWGVNVRIELTTTKVNDKLLEGYNPIAVRTGEVNNILFLARIEFAKGIFIAADTYEILKKKFNKLNLIVVGDGGELNSLKRYVAEKIIPDVTFTGRLDGEELSNIYKKSDLFIFPSYGEGMPTVVLEAMAFGLPVFTRMVGGVTDFFENDKMGYITDSFDPSVFANAMEKYIVDSKLTKKVSDYNVQYALSHFMASTVANKIEKSIKAALNG